MKKEPGVPASPSRRRAARAAVLAVSCLLVLGGCTQAQRAPGSYSGAEDNFLEGCTSRAEGDNQKVDDPEQSENDPVEIVDPEGYCQCVFNQIEKTVPWSEFKDTQSQMQDEGGALPSSIIEAYADCDPSAEGSKPISGSSSSDSKDSGSKDSDSSGSGSETSGS